MPHTNKIVQRLEGTVIVNCRDTYGTQLCCQTTDGTAILLAHHAVTCDTMVNIFILVIGIVLADISTTILQILALAHISVQEGAEIDKAEWSEVGTTPQRQTSSLSVLTQQEGQTQRLPLRGLVIARPGSRRKHLPSSSVVLNWGHSHNQLQSGQSLAGSDGQIKKTLLVNQQFILCGRHENNVK